MAFTLKVSFPFLSLMYKMWLIVFSSPFPSLRQLSLVRETRGMRREVEGEGVAQGRVFPDSRSHHRVASWHWGFTSSALSKVQGPPFIEAYGAAWFQRWGRREKRDGRLGSGFVYRELWEEKCGRIECFRIKEATDQIHFFSLMGSPKGVLFCFFNF